MRITQHFLIGYIKGTMWGLCAGALVSFLVSLATRQAKFLWLALVLELLLPLIMWMKHELEKGRGK